MLSAVGQCVPPVRRKRAPMTRINEAYLDCVIYLYPRKTSADEGEDFGGSGFLVRVPSDAHTGFFHYYAVSNRHVVEGERGLEPSPIIRLNNHEGGKALINKELEEWTLSDDNDLAVCPVGLEREKHRFRAVDQFLTRELLSSKPYIGIGDEVFIAGRFVNQAGKQKNTPSVRFGHISMLPQEPVDNPFSGKPQESFLVDAKTRSGYSGSPVFVYLDRPEFRKVYDPNDTIQAASPWQCWLLGIEWGQVPEPVKVQVTIAAKGQTHIGEQHFNIGTGMAGVIPAWRLAALLDIEELKTRRKAADDALADTRANPSIVPESGE
jgi:Trypsin-like peptidase domain